MADTNLTQQQNEQDQANSGNGGNGKAVPTGDGFSNDLGLIMSKKGITPKALADDMDVHISTVYYWLSARTLPTSGMVFRIARALGVAPLLLYGCITEDDAYKLDRANRKAARASNHAAGGKEEDHA